MRKFLLLWLCVTACFARAINVEEFNPNNFSTYAYTGLSCPYALRMMEPQFHCVTRHGVPQKGCRVRTHDDVYLVAYDLKVSATAITDCFRVEWFWESEIYIL